MGHIDHGKSSLLDYIRKANVVAGEAGGITQHVAAYVARHKNRPITFLDTPGHEAFETLRERGAAVADIAILVVAADEGVKPQTIEALAAITKAGIPYLVALTKIDKNNADIEHAKASLLEHGVYLEGLGGDIPFVPVSSKTGAGIPELLDLVLLAADLAELTADPTQSATGFVLESTQDPKRGVSATLIMRDGSLTCGGFVVAGGACAPVRFIEDFSGARIERAGPSEPVRISGFSALPAAGSLFSVVATKKEAERCVAEQVKEKGATAHADTRAEGVTELPLIIKADVAGSIEAILHELTAITHEPVPADRQGGVIRVVASGVGSVSESDVKTARAVDGVIIAFHVGTDAVARDLADRDHISIYSFSIIYELSEKVAELLTARIPTIDIEREIGRARVLKVFSASAKKAVLGLRHLSGTLSVGDRMKLMRRGEEIARGSITNLQLARANVREVKVEGDFGAEVELGAPAAYGDELVAFVATTS